MESESAMQGHRKPCKRVFGGGVKYQRTRKRRQNQRKRPERTLPAFSVVKPWFYCRHSFPGTLFIGFKDFRNSAAALLLAATMAGRYHLKCELFSLKKFGETRRPEGYHLKCEPFLGLRNLLIGGYYLFFREKFGKTLSQLVAKGRLKCPD